MRIVALGDSTTEGVGDPALPGGDGKEGPLRGWADRLAERVAATGTAVAYANLAVRGRKAKQIREEQLAPAVALEPDVALMTAGLNDLLRPRASLAAVLGELAAMHAALHEVGATVLMFTLPDLSSIAPAAAPVRGRMTAYNDGLRALGAVPGTVVVDVAAYPLGSDRRLWAPDRLHPSPLGHERLAAAAAFGLGLPGADERWTTSLEPPPRPPRVRVLAEETLWVGRHMTPWITRRLRGRSSGDGRVAKRPELLPVEPRST